VYLLFYFRDFLFGFKILLTSQQTPHNELSPVAQGSPFCVVLQLAPTKKKKAVYGRQVKQKTNYHRGTIQVARK